MESDGQPECVMTTIRAAVSQPEHDAIRHCSKSICHTTIDAFVKEAVWASVKKSSGKTVEELVANPPGRVYQPTLFDI